MVSTFWKFASVTLATGLGIGRVPVAPGTFGSLAAAVVAVPIVAAGGPLALGFAAAAAALVGIPTAAAAARAMKREDPGAVVIDEFAGQWLALLPAANDLGAWCLAFLAFRLFDVWKPGPVGWADRKIGGGLGIMLDDVIAGILAAGTVALAQPFLPPTVALF
ncbi:Phosphatidylglycerophosphatase A and related protein [uncultured Alphaproteobacteria bacterium]|uniref:Phosphatidylglycerophosphatase A n=1 Tax=uncultured Alphaproteobacteria bacterium TaxID=91750 RepID=A0A212J7C3_9PROT|nr:Phosphatidylglycerophosphatase A and related protein [uncultured Alphaproteobacteria bacterium]